MAEPRIPGVQYDEYGRPMSPTLREPMDFVRYVDSLGANADPGSVRQANEIRRNPSGWEMSGGHPKKKDDWLAANLPWLGPAIVGAGIGGAALAGGSAIAGGGGGAAASAGGGGLLPATHPATSMLWGAPSAGLSGAASAGIPYAAGSAGADFLGDAARKTANRGSDGLLENGMNQWQQAALAALSGLPALLANRGPSNEEKAALDQARQLQALQQKRIEHQGPLYEAVTRLAMSRMPAGVQMPIQPLDRG